MDRKYSAEFRPLLTDRALQVLFSNRIEFATKPAPSLYPHQWNWDSAFIAMGLAHVDQPGARRELKSLFRGQWRTGMIPHILFDPEASKYFPGSDFWNCRCCPDAVTSVETSGITQPPILAWAAHQIYSVSDKSMAALEFLDSIFDYLSHYQQFFRQYRTVGDDGLVCIIHPWESGLDNSPCWDPVLENIESAAELEYKRSDTRLVSDQERPTDRDHSRYAGLVELFRNNGYDQRAILKTSPFVVQPALFNTLLCIDLDALIRIGSLLGRPTAESQEWRSQLKNSLNDKLWDETAGFYGDFDLVNQCLIRQNTIAGYLPLAGEIPDEQRARRMITTIIDASTFWPADGYPVTTVAMTAPEFDPVKYWRGPVWININWLLIRGLRAYGHNDSARELTDRTVDLIENHGFYEYFNPFSGQGCGTDLFSWTAALLIDLLAEVERR
ncbi:MAG: trehalase family glycosidase [Candidatus Neomarinimicrobiota bacterium]